MVFALGAAARLVGAYGNGAMPEGVGDLQDRIDALGAAILSDASLPPEMKSFLSAQVDRIRVALREFVIRGQVSADDAEDAIAGAVLRANQTHPIEEWSAPARSKLKAVLEAS